MINNFSIKKNLKYSTIEGSLWAFMYGMGENFLSALAVFLGYSALQISVLNSFPQLIGSCFQLFSYFILKKINSTKKFVVILSLIQSVMWLLLILILLYNPDYKIIITWFIIYFLCGYLISPVWTSWMGYLVPKRIRGNYYGSRNRIINSFVLIAILIGGFVLKLFDNNLMVGFIILFFIASIGRFLSTYYLNKKDEIINLNQNSDNSFLYFLSDEKTLMFIFFKFFINFSVMFLGPLFAIYILRTLELSNFILSLCGVSWWLANVFSSKYWGLYSKENGNLIILKITTIILTVLPLMWISVYYSSGLYLIVLVIIINLFAGITFSGFSLASFNLIYELVGKKDVVKFTSLMHLGEGSAIFVGSILAGSIVDSVFLKNLFVDYNFTSIQFSMLISTILRAGCFFYFLKLQKKLTHLKII